MSGCFAGAGDRRSSSANINFSTIGPRVAADRGDSAIILFKSAIASSSKSITTSGIVQYCFSPMPVLTESEEYAILDALNLQLQAIACTLDPNPFALLSIEFLRTRISALPQTRQDQLKAIVASLHQAEQAAITEAIGGKRRLIKADVLEWSDKDEMTNAKAIGELNSSLATRIRLILGLDSIASMLVKYGTGQSLGQARLYRS